MNLTKIPRIYQQVAAQMREQIFAHCKAGDRLEPEIVLARKMGVSSATMRSALVILAGEGLIERSPKRGTFILDRAVRKHVGILVETDVHHPRASGFYRRLIFALREKFGEGSLPVKVYLGTVPPDRRALATTCEDFLADVLQDRLSALITIATTPDESWLGPLQSRGVPILGSIEDYPTGIGFDTDSIVTRGTRHLIERGCKRPALISLASPSPDRRELFLNSIRESGLAVEPGRQIRCVPAGQPGAAWEAVRELFIGTSASTRPDGILISDDTLLQDSAIALLELGMRIPEDVRLASHLNTGEPLFLPFPFTCITTNIERYAEAAHALICRMMAGSAPNPDKTRVAVEIVEYLPPVKIPRPDAVRAATR